MGMGGVCVQRRSQPAARNGFGVTSVEEGIAVRAACPGAEILAWADYGRAKRRPLSRTADSGGVGACSSGRSGAGRAAALCAS